MDFNDGGQITVYYRLEEIPGSPQAQDSSFFVLASSVILAVSAIIVALIIRNPAPSLFPAYPLVEGLEMLKDDESGEKAPTLELTNGKKEMMETFNKNDLKIVNLLLERKGKSRRNALARKSGISKSSLTMALNRLEKRKIVELDRTSTTHFVKLSDYFLRL